MEPDVQIGAEPAYAVGELLVNRYGGEEGRPSQFDLLGLRWDLLPGVFAPVCTASTELFSEWMPYPVGGSFLEVGCGAGVTAVAAALRGCERVMALDISTAAVANAVLNAARHGVADTVRTRRSDLFDALDPQESFDVIFWNSNVVLAPEDFQYSDDVHWSIFDRGYQAHWRYLLQGPSRLTGTGRLLLGFNTLGDRVRLDALAASAGLAVTELHSHTSRTGDVPVTFQLLELTRAELRAPAVAGPRTER
jgi:release factor glutamine methyltransferase